VPDILGRNPLFGHVVPRGDTSAFAAALGELLDDPQRTAMGRAAQERAGEAFSLDVVGKRLKTFLFSAG
jgi:glycosyltransferase involved in cell wall biosynthesis